MTDREKIIGLLQQEKITIEDINRLKKFYKDGYKYVSTNYYNDIFECFVYKNKPEYEFIVDDHKWLCMREWKYKNDVDSLKVEKFNFYEEERRINKPVEFWLEKNIQSEIARNSFFSNSLDLCHTYSIKRLLEVSIRYFQYKNIPETDKKALENLYSQGFRFIALDKIYNEENNKSELYYYAYKKKPICSINEKEAFFDFEPDENGCRYLDINVYHEFYFLEDCYPEDETKTLIEPISVLKNGSFSPYKIRDFLESMQEAGINLNITLPKQGSRRYCKIKVRRLDMKKIIDFFEENDIYFEEC